MLRNLLAERFHLEVHRESKELAGFELVLAKRLPGLQKSEDIPGIPESAPATGSQTEVDRDGFPQLSHPGMITMMATNAKGEATERLTAKAQPISRLTQLLSGQLNKPLADKSGLTGNYDFQLEFAPEGLGPDAADDALPDIRSAIQKQLRLRLESGKTPVNMLIIDRIEKAPTEN
jgi:uncharacterized protein (TIGR03435 family)